MQGGGFCPRVLPDGWLQPAEGHCTASSIAGTGRPGDMPGGVALSGCWETFTACMPDLLGGPSCMHTSRQGRCSAAGLVLCVLQYQTC